MLGIELAAGSLIFLVFLVGFTVVVAYAVYGRRGNGIPRRAYGKIYTGAPGAREGESRLRGRDRHVSAWTRGTH